MRSGPHMAVCTANPSSIGLRPNGKYWRHRSPWLPANQPRRRHHGGPHVRRPRPERSRGPADARPSRAKCWYLSAAAAAAWPLAPRARMSMACGSIRRIRVPGSLADRSSPPRPLPPLRLPRHHRHWGLRGGGVSFKRPASVPSATIRIFSGMRLLMLAAVGCATATGVCWPAWRGVTLLVVPARGKQWVIPVPHTPGNNYASNRFERRRLAVAFFAGGFPSPARWFRG